MLVVMVVLGSGAAALGLWAFYGPNHFFNENERVVFVSRGQTLTSVIDSLDSRGVIRSRLLFRIVARISGGEDRLHVGKYSFSSGTSNIRILESLRDGSGVIPIVVTIREGIRSRTQARVFRRTLSIDSARFVTLVHDPEFARSLGIDRNSLEGYLMPETYNFNWQPDEKEIIRRMVNEFKQFYADSLQARAKEKGWTTNEVITFASIVEGETGVPEERPMISGVYHNRLRRGMKLEADPTIQFAIPDGPRRLFYSDLRIDNPYNTYRFAGLPPGPINNPGRDAIRAALYPARHNYIYFVANGRGGHWFSSNYADHQKYVRMYRRVRSQQQSAVFTDQRKTAKAPT